MTGIQTTFFMQLAKIQEVCVQQCRINSCGKPLEQMLYDVTYEMAVGILELLDGCSPFGGNPYELVDTVTGEALRGAPPLQLHDQAEQFLRTE